ncbi:putative UDP-glucose/GDP-mannose dehydrogenase (fragment) [Brochothrix thermosphacta]
MKKDNLKLGVLGLGYVGLPVAVAFGKKMPVMGLDVNQKRIEQLKHTHDETGEVTDEDLLSTNIDFTSDAKRLKECNFIIVAVPTPINESNQPDMRILHKASKMIGQNIQKGTTVVFESTVYPGATEEECAPIIEQWSGLVSGKDFFIGYSPERINPGDKTHTFTTILKIVSGQNEQTTERVADVYSSVVTAGVFKASSIKVAEAAKVIENTQRDLNIALMNELSQIFHELNIDTQEVLEAAGTICRSINRKRATQAKETFRLLESICFRINF